MCMCNTKKIGVYVYVRVLLSREGVMSDADMYH